MSDQEWHKWFAWYPVWDNQWFFWKTIYRRAEYTWYSVQDQNNPFLYHQTFDVEWLYTELNPDD